MKTNFDATTFVKPSMERAKEIIETSVENYHNMYITISKKPEADPFLHHTFLVPIRLEHKHADGKTMREHIVPKISDASDRENYNIFFGIDDINSIIIEYKLRELIKSSRNGFVANDDKAKALLEAFEFERNNKEQDMEMSN